MSVDCVEREKKKNEKQQKRDVYTVDLLHKRLSQHTANA